MSLQRQLSDMQSVKVKRDELLSELNENMQNHRETFLEAQKIYREQVITELDEMLSNARKGNKIKKAITWPEPEDHTNDYKTAVRMLEMCVDDTIEISMDDFERLVMDNWGWTARWSETVSNYTIPKAKY